MALMRAEEPEVYRDLQELTDPYEKQRPQRHNIIFEDGWPSDNRWYSTENLARAQGKDASNTTSGKGHAFYSMHGTDFASDIRESFEDMKENIRIEISEELQEELEDLQEEIRDTIQDELDIDSLRDEVMESVRGTMDALREAAAQATASFMFYLYLCSICILRQNRTILPQPPLTIKSFWPGISSSLSREFSSRSVSTGT